MGGEMLELARAGEQRTGSPRVPAGELVAADGSRVEERLELGADAIDLLFGDDAFDHDTAGFAQRRLDLVEAAAGIDPGDVHRHLPPTHVTDGSAAQATLPRYPTGTSWAWIRFMSSRGLNGLIM